MTRKISQLLLVFSLFLSCAAYAGQDGNAPWQPDEKLAGLAKLFETGKVRQIIVDINGSGDFNSLQQAIDSIPQDNSERVVVLIKPGFYKQRVIIPKSKSFITLRGTDPYNTIISYDLNAQMMRPDGLRTYGADCATLVVREATDIILENLTIENTFGPHPQAQAVKLASDRAIVVNCRFLGGQDTLMTHSGRQYYLNTYIEGGTDFIYGHAQAVFENCLIHSNESSHITAHAATEPNLPTGYVFYNCRVTTANDVMTDLGRPWRAYARVVYYNCWLDKGIKPTGWDNWRDPNREKTAFYAEFKCSGPGVNPAARVKWSHQLTDEESVKFLPENFMKVDGQTVDEWLQKILDFRKAPLCSSNVYDVRQYGAKGDGKTPDTEAIQKAIDECGKAGGGIVRLTAGVYLSKPISLRSEVTLQLDEGVKLKATDDPQDFLRPGRTLEKATGSGDFVPFIGGKGLTNIAIAGKGLIDGSGVRWWIPAEEARGKSQGYPRPRLILLEGCKNVKITGVTIVNSPSFHLVPRRCENVLIEGVTIRSPSIAPNTDAIDPSESRHVYISKCLIDVGDDDVAIKSGRANPAHPNAACEYITVTDCVFLHGHGMSIGSETVGGVRNMTVQRCRFENMASGIRIKSAPGRGGLVENITYKDIVMKNVKIPISISSSYMDSTQPELLKPATTQIPIYRNIYIKNVTATSPYGAADFVDRMMDFIYYYYAYHAYLEPRNAGIIAGLPGHEISDIVLENVSIKAPIGMTIQDARAIKLNNVKIKVQDGPPFILKNAAVKKSGINWFSNKSGNK